jgi:seryl-tRNA synthetase
MSEAMAAQEIGLESPVAQLSRLREWTSVGGEVHLGPRMNALIDWLDSKFVAFAIEAGALQMPVPQFIERSVLERAGYFDSFPHQVILDNNHGGCLSPATCYHCYAKLAAASLPEPGIWTCISRCGREEGKQELGRLRTFMMREIVLVGTAGWLRRQRRDWMDRMLAFAESVQLMVTLQPASDPFFAGGAARGRMLLQQIKELKYEMRAPLGRCGTELAVASFNLHETFFSRRFGFAMNDRSAAHSGCIAFGLERWALALAIQLGPARAFKLSEQEHK